MADKKFYNPNDNIQDMEPESVQDLVRKGFSRQEAEEIVQSRQEPDAKKEPGLLERVGNGLSKASLPDSGTMAGRTNKTVYGKDEESGDDDSLWGTIKKGVGSLFGGNDDMREIHDSEALKPSDPKDKLPGGMTKEEVASFGPDAGNRPSVEDKVKDRVTAKRSVAKIKTAGAAGNVRAMDSAAQGVIDQAYMNLPADQADSFAAEVKALREELKVKNDRLDLAEVIERVGQGLTQMVGAMYGLKHGVNMSGMKFDPTDWDRKRSAIHEQFKTDFSDVAERRKANRDEIATARDINFRASESSKNRTADRENLLTREEGENARTAMRIKGEKEAAQIRANITANSQNAAEGRLKNKAFDKAIMNLRSASKAKSDEEAEALRSAAEASLLDTGLGPDQIKKIMTRPTEWYEFGAETDAEPDVAAENVVKAKAGVTETTDTGKDPKIEAYAKQYNMSYEQAQAIIEKRKAGK